jgi:hypothetical protein
MNRDFTDAGTYGYIPEAGLKDETIIMDLKGNVPKTVYLPVFIRPGVEEKMYDARYTAIADDTWFALKPDREKRSGVYIENRFKIRLFSAWFLI